jgi:hypothetical protein
VRLLERDGINKKVLMSRGALDQNEWSGKNIMRDAVLEDKAWYILLRTPKENKKPKKYCWVHLNAVLVDQCNELLWYIFHTCENHKDKNTLAEKLDAFIDIRTNCTIREVGTYMKGVFNIEDEDNWMLHSQEPK